jgi:opacity protein-like surface antigen
MRTLLLAGPGRSTLHRPRSSRFSPGPDATLAATPLARSAALDDPPSSRIKPAPVAVSTNICECVSLDQTQLKALTSVTGRVGQAWDRFLVYVKAGGAWLRGDYSFQTFGTPVGPTASLTQTGYTVGVGGEYAFLNWLTGFVEYDYYNFSNSNPSTLVCTVAVCGIATTGVTVRTDINVVKAGLNLKFGPF